MMTESKQQSSMLYCWGSSHCGQLGLPGAFELQHENGTTLTAKVELPVRLKALNNIQQVAAGLEHTLFLTNKGEVLVCGNGEVGQLGILLPTSIKQIHSPVPVLTLKDHQVVQVAAGEQHSVAITSNGEVYSWGDNTFGQTGIGGGELEGPVSYPARNKTLAHLFVVQVACGAHHTLALTSDGCVYGWGLNSNGQLGLFSAEPLRKATLVVSLRGLPVMQLCCGGQMSACVSRCGYLLTWGSNRHGQLGRTIVSSAPKLNQDSTSSTCSATPKVVPNLASYSVPIVHVAVGSSHVAALDADGKLWTFGNGSFGCTGHGGAGGSDSCLNTPRTVLDLVGSTVTQVECGRNHTLALAHGNVYSFGDGSSGQLGLAEMPTQGYVTAPRQLKAHWQISQGSPSKGKQADASVQTITDAATDDNSEQMEVDEPEQDDSSPVFVKQVFCGGDCSFLLTTACPRQSFDRTVAAWGPAPVPPPPTLSAAYAADAAAQVATSAVPLPPPDSMDICLSPAPVAQNKAITSPTTSGNDASYRLLPVYELQLCHVRYLADLQPDQRIVEDVFTYVETALASVACWNQSFLAPLKARDPNEHYIDFIAASSFMSAIESITRDTVKDMITSGIQSTASSLPSSCVTSECLRAYILLLMTPHFSDPRLYRTLQVPYASRASLWSKKAKSIMENWLTRLPLDIWEKMVKAFVKVVGQSLTEGLPQQIGLKPEFVCLYDMLKLLYDINKSRTDGIAPNSFYVDEIFDRVLISEDYKLWLQKQLVGLTRRTEKTAMFYCDYPFLFNAVCKNVVLRVDSMIQMQHAIRSTAPLGNLQMGDFSSVLLHMFGGPNLAFDPHLNLKIRRDNILQDAFDQISTTMPKELKKPLKVEFMNEEAQDDGGVRKEFFLLLMRELLNPNYGMFQEYEASRYIWFRENSYESKQMFHLVGTLCGLAIYNSIIINLPFPLPLYKKILNEPMTLDDLTVLDPVMGKNMRELLEYEGDDVEEMMCLNFTLDRVYFDEVVSKELKPGGADIPVTNENREEYVELIVEYILTKSIEEEYSSFCTGFERVCGGEVLRMFQPVELMALVVGNEDYDWEAFKSNTFYKGEYTADHETIVLFWSVFQEMPLEDKKKFLLFLTGCDRVPLLGMRAIKMVIEPMQDSRLLPVAHTCVHQLDLPKYATKERLKYKLLQAIQHYEGFGLV